MIYVFWYFFEAKTSAPLTLDDLALAWKLHKKQTGCTVPSIYNLLVKNENIVGFNCKCGYEFTQKRLITQRIHVRARVRRNLDEIANYLSNV